MPGLGKGLTKEQPQPRDAATEDLADQFIQGARQRRDLNEPPAKRPRTRRFLRCTFSLTQEVSDAIERLSLLPRTFHSNRSEVVKAAIEWLETLPEEQIIELLKQTKQVS
jgi:hypothetical protein